MSSDCLARPHVCRIICKGIGHRLRKRSSRRKERHTKRDRKNLPSHLPTPRPSSSSLLPAYQSSSYSSGSPAPSFLCLSDVAWDRTRVLRSHVEDGTVLLHFQARGYFYSHFSLSLSPRSSRCGRWKRSKRQDRKVDADSARGSNGDPIKASVTTLYTIVHRQSHSHTTHTHRHRLASVQQQLSNSASGQQFSLYFFRKGCTSVCACVFAKGHQSPGLGSQQQQALSFSPGSVCAFAIECRQFDAHSLPPFSFLRSFSRSLARVAHPSLDHSFALKILCNPVEAGARYRLPSLRPCSLLVPLLLSLQLSSRIQ